VTDPLLTDVGLLLTFMTSLLAYLASRSNRAKISLVDSKIGVVDDKVVEVHQLVNNQLDRQLDRNAELTATLTAAGVDVPVQHTTAPVSVAKDSTHE
jgi:hypothetical protein